MVSVFVVRFAGKGKIHAFLDDEIRRAALFHCNG
jgi:hypothetical protein